MELRDVIGDVVDELSIAQQHFFPFASAHEGYAILLEEVEELWDEVRKHPTYPGRDRHMRVEAIQVAAMAIRFVLDVCDGD